jgi:hypothetical protein
VLQIASANPDGPEFASLVNAATRQLMTRGSWWGTVQGIRGCVYDGCVVWPRTVSAVLALNANNHPTIPANRWYEYMQWDGQCSDWAGAYSRRHRGHAGRHESVNDGTLPVFNPIPDGQCRLIRFYIDNPNDAGKTIRIYGKDGNGQMLTGIRPDNTVQDGIVLTLQLPYVETNFLIRRIDRVVKDPTLSRVRGYQVDTDGILYDMCVYEAGETSPDYFRTRVHARTGRGCCPTMINALVKLAFVPVRFDDDLVLIENMDALRDMVMSIKEKEAGHITESRAAEQSAFRELNYELRNRVPDEQVIVSFRPFGNDSLAGQGTGMI